MVKQAGARVLSDVRGVWEDVRAQPLVAVGSEPQVRGGDRAVELAEIAGRQAEDLVIALRSR